MISYYNNVIFKVLLLLKVKYFKINLLKLFFRKKMIIYI